MISMTLEKINIGGLKSDKYSDTEFWECDSLCLLIENLLNISISFQLLSAFCTSQIVDREFCKD